MNSNDLFIEDKLPEPLNSKELNFYFEKMHAGDTKARKVIIEHNIKLVLFQVEKFFNHTPYEPQELVSVGIFGLIKSVDTFDTSKKIQFSSYASKCIHNEILMFIRKCKKHLNDNNFDNVISVDKNGNVTGKSAGTATITVTTSDGGKTASKTITVKKVETKKE